MTQTEWIVSLDDDLKDGDELFVGNVRDGEQLIRCKDCKHWRIHISDAETCGERFEIDGSELITDADDFCSRAERKE